MTDVLEQVVLDEQLDFEPACEWGDVEAGEPDCVEPARWVARTLCCGDPSLACDEHRRSALIEQKRDPDQFYCGTCGAEPCLVEFEPLGGRDG